MIQFPIGLNNLDVQYESDVDSFTSTSFHSPNQILNSLNFYLSNVSLDILRQLVMGG